MTLLTAYRHYTIGLLENVTSRYQQNIQKLGNVAG